MSIDDDEAQREQWLEDLYRTHKQEILSELTGERVRAYFQTNPLVARPASIALDDAQRLRDAGFVTPSFLFAVISIEVAVKNLLLKPVMNGVVHDPVMSTLIADLALGRNGVGELRDLLFYAVGNVAGVDMKTYRRCLGATELWSEIRSLQTLRNRVVHRADAVSADDAETAIAVSTFVLQNLFTALAKAVRLHVHVDDQWRVCDDSLCALEPVLAPELIAKLRSLRSG